MSPTHLHRSFDGGSQDASGQSQFDQNSFDADQPDGAAYNGNFAPSDAAFGSNGIAASGGTASDIESEVTSTQTITTPGSGMVFNNTYGAGDTQAYINCIVAAEQDIASHFTNAITLNLTFDAQNKGNTGDLANNNWASFVAVSYSSLKTALASHATTLAGMAAVASLPASDPNPAGGKDWNLPEAYARMLGLSSSTPATDDTVTLNTYYNWSYGQDVIGTVEHEITEGGMGRVGGLGDQNGVWSTMDLFRYSSPGVRDYTDGRDGETTYFSLNGSALSLLQFNNEYSGATKVNTGDTADFTQSDIFGTGQTGDSRYLSITDVEVMEALGWNTSDPGFPTAVSNSFNGDLESGVLFENPSSGQVYLWDMNGLQIVNSGSIGLDNGFNIVGTGDLNGDTRTDIVFQNPSNGQVWAWEIDGTNGFKVSASGSLGFTNGFNVVGMGDFNGDGKSDILFQNPGSGQVWEWQMNGLQIATASSVGNANAFQVVGTGDFNDDGKSDILFQNPGSGEVWEWEMNGSQIIGSGSLGFTNGFDVVGTGDFNGDGKSDILFENPSTGQLYEWQMNGLQVASGASLGFLGAGFNVVATGDYFGDGKSGVLAQNPNSGEVYEFQVNGLQITGGGFLGSGHGFNAV